MTDHPRPPASSDDFPERDTLNALGPGGGPQPAPAPPSLADYTCAGCGYALDGLHPDGVCPECGMPIRRSLSRELLRDASPAYIEALSRGSLLVLISLIASAVITVLGVVMSIIVAIGTAGAGAGTGVYSPSGVELLFVILGFFNSLLGVYGWWLLSSPDPRHGSKQQSQARRVLRTALIVLAVSYLLSTALQIAMMGGGATPAMGTGTMAAMLVVGVVSLIAWVIMFISAMLYLKGLARRIPDLLVEHRAGMYTWLLPLIYVVGTCLVVGPLVAFVMYALLINRVRQNMNAIRREQALLEQVQSVGPGAF